MQRSVGFKQDKEQPIDFQGHRQKLRPLKNDDSPGFKKDDGDKNMGRRHGIVDSDSVIEELT